MKNLQAICSFPSMRAMLLAVAAGALACAMPAHAAEPAVSVSVVPRIGLFHEVQYVRTSRNDPPPIIGAQAEKWSPMDRQAFLDAVAGQEVATVIQDSIKSNWEILTTHDPATNYARRKIRVALRNPADTPVISCAVNVRNRTVQGKRTNGGCELAFDLEGNAAQALVVLYRTQGMTADAQVQAQVPEDYLVVIAGDSYASGEGNPDRPCDAGSPLSCGTQALWMDEECHRSFWSAGMRSALRLIKDDSAGRHGAYTVVNLACSGAGMAEGMLGNYGGVVKLRDMVANHRESLKLDADKIATDVRKIPPQINVMDDLVKQRPEGRGIDLLVVSAGGNDLQFGAVVVGAILGKHKLDWIKLTESELEKRFREYRNAFAQFATRLRKMPVRQVVWVPYPNVTDIGPGNRLPAACASGPVAALKKFTSFGIDVEERALAHRVLVTQLNDGNQENAVDQRYYMLSRDAIDKRFKGEGWCSDAKPEGPYKKAKRLVRKADESLQYQGGLHGAMHPTFEAHEFMSTLIDDVLERGRADPLVLAVDGGVIDGNGRAWLPAPVRVRVKDKSNAPVTGHEVCAYTPGTGFMGCRMDAYELDVSQVDVNQPWMLAVHGSTKRRFLQRLPALAVDSTPPAMKGCMHRSEWGEQPCGIRWVHPGDSLSFTATDSQSGLASLRVFLLRGDQETPLVGTPIKDGVVVAAESLPSGPVELVVRARDRVGNEQAEARPLRVDRVPPVLKALTVHGATFMDAASLQRDIPSADPKLRVDVAAEDAHSPLVAAGYRTPGLEPAFDTSTAFMKNVGSCNLQSAAPPKPALGGTVEFAGSQASMWAMDCTMQKSEPWELQIVRIPPRQAPALLPAEWAQLGAPAALHGTVSRMTRLFASAPAASDAGFPIYAAWLNVADGRLAPAIKVPVQVQAPSCQPVAAAPGMEPTLYAVLMAAEQCAQQLATRADERERFLRSLSDKLVAQP